MSNNSHDISTLNGLIATTIDSVDGYTEAAKDSDFPRNRVGRAIRWGSRVHTDQRRPATTNCPA